MTCFFLFMSIALNYNPYECGKSYSYNNVIIKIEITIEKILDWFCNKDLKTNASKCLFFLSPCKPMTIKIKDSAKESSKSETLLGVYVDSNLSFDNHITSLCCKKNQKIHAL